MAPGCMLVLHQNAGVCRAAERSLAHTNTCSEKTQSVGYELFEGDLLTEQKDALMMRFH